jgi:succinyl-CoA synthetase alpha subunit
MSIFINSSTKVLVQGITGLSGNFHTEQMIQYGTKIVAGVTPDKGGNFYKSNIPIFNSVIDAIEQVSINASVIYVPAKYAADAIIESIEAGILLIVCITEGIPILDMIKVKNVIENSKTRLIGPNCPGIITPGECKIGIMPSHIHKIGNIGVISRSGTLTYEAVNQLTKDGLGQSTCIGIGGDPIIGTNFIDALRAFNDDKYTDAIVMIGEIGGNSEENAAIWIKNNMTKPVIAFIAGITAPKNKIMGHAGAIVSYGKGTALEKITSLKNAGVRVALTIKEISIFIREAII